MTADDLRRAPEQLQTARLDLRLPQEAFAPAFIESLNASLPGLGWIRWGQQAQTLDWALDFMRRSRDFFVRGEGLVYFCFERASGAYVGNFDLHSWDFEAPRCEVGYVGDARTAGRGFMREAVLAGVGLAFSLGAARVQALSDAGNPRALHFAQTALGLVREGVLKNYERDALGRLGDQVLFAAYNPAAS